MDRRQFLKGLLATVAAAAVTRNGILQPEPERTIFDMGPALAKYRAQKTILTRPGLWVHSGGEVYTLVGRLDPETRLFAVEAVTKDDPRVLPFRRDEMRRFLCALPCEVTFEWKNHASYWEGIFEARKADA